MITQTIQMILAPVVMVTACGLILSGLLARYAAVNDRLRALTRERLDLWGALDAPGVAPASAVAYERLAEIDAQTPDLVRHHRLLHHAVLAIYSAVAVFVACMVVIALVTLADWAWLATGALLVFLGGTATLLAGVLLAALEARTSHRAVHYEVQRVARLTPLLPRGRPAAVKMADTPTGR